MLKLRGYAAHEVVHRGPRFAVLRGAREADGAPVIIKVTAKEYPSIGEITKLKQEFEVARLLSIPGVVQCYAVENHGNAVALIMRDVGAVSLEQLAGGGPLPLDLFLTIAIKLAGALDAIHGKGIIHKDIKPANIVATRDGGVVEIIDFGMASLLSSERPRAPTTSRLVEGTLTHVSPEQTGRIHRTIDRRSDLYSLGITLYELLTGRLPFKAEDPLEMLHWHLAKLPEPPSRVEPAIPEAISAIVMRLLSKEPEERYQTAAGLGLDLERCREALSRGEPIDLGSLSRADQRNVLHIPERLYGRESEVASLLSTFDRVCSGPAELLLVSGYSGIGKSSLIREVERPIVARRGKYVSGKFDQYKRDVPYASFVQALGGLIQEALAERQGTLVELRGRLIAAMGEGGKIVAGMIPELAPILGDQPAPAELLRTDARRRVNDAFRSFIQLFTAGERALVIFLDDLQWADDGTLSLIHDLATDRELRNVLLIGAYRDNEVSPYHPMCVMLEDVRAAGARVGHLVLKPISAGDLEQLVADALRCRPADARPLAELVMEKTQGNPFFVGQLLQMLYQEGLVWFDAREDGWRWDLGALQRRGLTEDVVEFMIERVSRLEPATREVLQLAACIGSTFDLKTLAAVVGKTMKQTASALWAALEAKLVLPVGNAYRIPRLFDLDTIDDTRIIDMAEGATFTMLHDRLQQAAYSLIPPDRRKELHLQIGRLWLRSLREEEIEGHIFDLVRHQNAGLALITEPRERYRLAELNVIAARKAKVGSAFASMLQLASTAVECLPEACWKGEYRIAYTCHLELAEAEFLNGRYAEALGTLDAMELRVKGILDRCKLCELKILCYKMLGSLNAALDIGCTTLAELGVRLEQVPDAQRLREELSAAEAALSERRFEELHELPEMTDPEKIAACQLLQELWPVAFFVGSPAMHVAAMKMVQLSARYGNTRASVFGYMVYAFTWMFAFDDIERGYRVGLLSLKLNDRFQTRELEAKILDMWGGLMQHFKEPLRTGRETLWRGFTRGLAVGDYQWAGYCAGNYAHKCALGDVPLSETVAFLDQVFPTLRRYDPVIINYTLIVREAVASLIKEKAEPSRLVGEWCDEREIIEIARRTNDENILFVLSLYKLFVAIFFGEYDRVLLWGPEAESKIAASAGVWINPVFHYLQSVALLCSHEQIPEAQRAALVATVQRSLQRIELWGRHAPENFAHMALLVRAELCRIEGQGDAAMRLYDRAIAEAQARGFTQYQALSCERASRFYRERGAEMVADVYLKQALYCYELWGAEAKVRKLREQHPQLVAPGPDPAQGTTRYLSESVDGLDIYAVVKASQALSGEIVLSALLDALMRTVTEVAGADVGVLMLKCSDGSEELSIEVTSPPELVKAPMLARDCSRVPEQLLRHVASSREAVVLDAAMAARQFPSDPYLRITAPRSLLCAPLLRQGKLMGLLYLENTLMESAFSPEKVKVIEVLAAQAAISIENARLYDDLERRVTERTRELREAQQRLVESAHRAGMAEIATSVLHNVGNMLNSVNISATMMDGMLRRSSPEKLAKLAELFAASSDRLGDLLASDRGKAIPAYVDKLAQGQMAERDALIAELDRLRSNIDDIRVLLTLQQANATGVGVVEEVDLSGLLESALKIGLSSAHARGIEVLREIQALPPIRIERYKVQQILINLITNAAHAVTASAVEPKVLTLRLFDGGGARIHLEVADNGIGISAQNLPRIFQYGFTTRKGGHGFGLHASAIAAVEMGGRLVARSDGPGRGATFLLELPSEGRKEASARAG